MGRQRPEAHEYPPDLFIVLHSFDAPDLLGDEWLRLMIDAVAFYNAKHGTEFEPTPALEAYLDWSDAQNLR